MYDNGWYMFNVEGADSDKPAAKKPLKEHDPNQENLNFKFETETHVEPST